MRPDDVPAGPLLIDPDVATWLLTGVPESSPGSRTSRSPPDAVLRQRWRAARPARLPDLGHNEDRRVERSHQAQLRRAALHVKYRGHLQRGGANDLWVAASALSADPPLPLATNNLSDFTKVAADHPLRLVHPDL